MLQVRFVYEAFRKLRPGTPLRCLHGAMKQVRQPNSFHTARAWVGARWDRMDDRRAEHFDLEVAVIVIMHPPLTTPTKAKSSRQDYGTW
jgi:hypothetical protein